LRTLVIDASIAIKWVVEEEGTAEALALKRSARLATPDLLVPECANILWKKVRRAELSSQEASIAARLLARSEIELLPMRTLLERACRLAVDLDYPAYDCIYLALAEERAWPLVTADEQFLSRLRGRRRFAAAREAMSLAEAAAAG
jgi:predicted nucleic acid-binding protein